jgi:hypothetical protein
MAALLSQVIAPRTKVETREEQSSMTTSCEPNAFPCKLAPTFPLIGRRNLIVKNIVERRKSNSSIRQANTVETPDISTARGGRSRSEEQRESRAQPLPYFS